MSFISSIEQEIWDFRTICLEKYSEDIDIFEKGRNQRIVNPTGLDWEEFYFFNIKKTIYVQCAQLLNTPRQLKRVFHRVANAWDVLHGEVDFDDLFVINVLRLAAGEAFIFLLNNIQELRGLNYKSVLDDIDKRREKLHEKYENTTEKVGWNTFAGNRLIGLLFQEWQSETTSDVKPPQGVDNPDNDNNYWLRIIREGLFVDEVKDQDVFHSLTHWKTNHLDTFFGDKTLAEEIYDNSELSRKVLQFGKIFLDGDEIRLLSSNLFDVIISEHKAAANQKSSVAFINLWNLSTQLPISEADHQNWLFNEITKALPISLNFANDLYYYWKHNDGYSIGDKNKSYAILRNKIVKKTKEIYESSPDTFVKVLDLNSYYSLFQFSVYYSDKKNGGEGFNPANWQWLVNVVLSVLPKNFELVIIHLIGWIFSLSEIQDAEEYSMKVQFEQDHAELLFGDKLSLVMEYISKPFDLENFNNKQKYIIENAQNKAWEWLEKNK